MADSDDWSIPDEMQPSEADLGFDLARALDAMVAVRAEVPQDAFTASILGTDRSGNGVVIDEDGIVLTIGYLITEAQTVWLTTNRGQVVPGYPLAYDQATGFGLIRALQPLGAPALERGSADLCAPGDPVFVLGHGGIEHALRARLVDKREFAGYWEYMLDEALFTAPAHPRWSGAALLDAGGRLIGIGSLLIQESSDGDSVQGNMMVPIDLLEPILPSMLATGRSGQPARPWLGVYAGETGDQVLVGGVAAGGPAANAGIEQGDLILDVAGERVTELPEFLRAVWGLGPAGVKVPLKIARGGDVLRVEIQSVDRNDLLKGPRLH
ncbi:MAG: S1C family serine protease [Burkholderiaceae bacterium]|nr:S1C family serine protease [Burkholderiaceae bacterium]